ncbi:hypothetical protein [Thalassotalea atypica]|uniref:hypothetical protein n=1 Tax=Thalassotalea atypica TaxID=2054316 RepID=UPI0025737FCC|nr:hypothetical protein [Thalassotalea atypica]
MLSPVTSHDEPNLPVSQLIVMGKFILDSPAEQLTYSAELFGQSESERVINMTATSQLTGSERSFVLTPKTGGVSVF